MKTWNDDYPSQADLTLAKAEAIVKKDTMLDPRKRAIYLKRKRQEAAAKKIISKDEDFTLIG